MSWRDLSLPVKDPLVVHSSMFPTYFTLRTLKFTRRGGFLKDMNSKNEEFKQLLVKLNSTIFSGKNNVQVFSQDLGQ